MDTGEHHEPFELPPGAPKSFCVTVTLSSTGEEEIDRLAGILEELVQDNEVWIRDMLAMGVKPPCCAKCGGVLYREPPESDYQSGSIQFKGASAMFHDGIAACGTIAAYDAAALRVLEEGNAWVHIEDGGGGPSSYHAIVGTPMGTFDPTEKMIRG